MGRHARHAITLADGRQVGYAPKARNGLFRVQFKHPTEPGKYVEAATGVAVPKGWNPKKPPPPAWIAEAEKAIKDAYAPAPGDSLGTMAKATWEEAEKYLLEDIQREGSKRTYRSAMSVVRAGLPGLTGPADVTPAHATRFAKKYAAERFRRSKSANAVLRPRSAQTVWSTLNNLSVMWTRLKKLRLVTENVWSEVERPRVPKKLPRTPSEESLGELFKWLDQRFPGPGGAGVGAHQDVPPGEDGGGVSSPGPVSHRVVSVRLKGRNPPHHGGPGQDAPGAPHLAAAGPRGGPDSIPGGPLPVGAVRG